MAASGELGVAEFQNDIDVSTEMIVSLAHNIMNDENELVFLSLWNPLPLNPKSASRYPTAVTKTSKMVLWGLDRLLAVCVLMNRRPAWMTDDEFAEFEASHRVVFDPHGRRFVAATEEVPYTIATSVLLGEKTPNWDTDAICTIKSLKQTTQTVTRLRQFRNAFMNAKMRVYTYKMDSEQAAEKYRDLNSAVLDATDRRLSEIAGRAPGWVTRYPLAFVEELRGTYPQVHVSVGQILESLFVVGDGTRRIGVDELNAAPKELKVRWPAVADSWRRLCEYLTTHGFLDGMRCDYQLLPLVLLGARFEDAFFTRRPFIWLLRCELTQRYRGPNATMVDTDIQIVASADSADEALDKLLGTVSNAKVSSSRLLDQAKASRDRRGILYQIMYSTMLSAGAKDWLDPSQRLDPGNIHWHHTFPVNRCVSLGIGSDEYNVLANLSVLSVASNLQIKDQDPAFYLRDVDESLLAAQFWDARRLVGYQGNPNRIRRLIRTRAKVLAKAMNEFLTDSAEPAQLRML